jgi:hypothetical protein
MQIEQLLVNSVQPNTVDVANESTLQPSKSHRWSQCESTLLLQAIEQHGLGDWTKIAGAVGNGRTRAQCAQRWFRCLNPSISKGHWNAQEDARLLQSIRIFGTNCWARIS